MVLRMTYLRLIKFVCLSDCLLVICPICPICLIKNINLSKTGVFHTVSLAKYVASYAAIKVIRQTGQLGRMLIIRDLRNI